jgi:membrane-anchored protein YejM (alkaline phosphatase superfamily)
VTPSLLYTRASGSEHDSGSAQLARISAARALALAMYFIFLKLYLAWWYTGHDVLALSETPKWAIVGLGGSDFLAAAAVFAIALVVGLPAMLRRNRALQAVGKIASVLPFLAAGLLACVSLRVNQAYGRPLSFGILSFASSLGPMRDSIVGSVDLTFVLLALLGVSALLAAPWIFRAEQWRIGAIQICLVVFAMGVVGGAVAFALFRNVNTFGLKTNPLIELARSYPVHTNARDYGAEFATLSRDLAEKGGEKVSDVSVAMPGSVPGLTELRGIAAGRNLVLIVLESSAARYVDRTTSPALTRLGDEGLRYNNHFTTAPSTFPAQYSLYHSNYFPMAALNARELYSAAPADTSLFETFKKAGYQTAVFCSAFLYFADLAWLFESNGVDTIVGGEVLRRPDRPVQSWGVAEPQTIEAMISWIASRKNQRFFAVYNPIIPHHPYFAPVRDRQFEGTSVEDNYRNALYYTDQRIDDLLKGLRQLGLREKTVVVVVSDHGETVIGPRGAAGHGVEFSSSEFHIPFLISAPGLIHGGQSESLYTNHLDVAPTIAAMFGFRAPAGWSGRNLLAPRVPRRILFVGLGAGNKMGLIDNGVAFSHDLNLEKFQAYVIRGETFAPTRLDPATEATYRGAAETFEDKLLLRHLRLAFEKGPRHLPDAR